MAKAGDLAAHVAGVVMQHGASARLRLATPAALPRGGMAFQLRDWWRLVVSPWDSLPAVVQASIASYLEPHEVAPRRMVPKGESRYTREDGTAVPVEKPPPVVPAPAPRAGQVAPRSGQALQPCRVQGVNYASHGLAAKALGIKKAELKKRIADGVEGYANL